MNTVTTEHTTQPTINVAPQESTKSLSVVRPVSQPDLDTINDVVAEATASWGLADRVRRLALPSLYYTESDLEQMTVVLLDQPDARGVGLATWEKAGDGELSPGLRAVLLHGLYVKPEWQRLGLGTNLLEFAENWARARGQDAIALRAWRQSEPFFTARGFRPWDRGRTPDLYPRGFWKVL